MRYIRRTTFVLSTSILCMLGMTQPDRGAPPPPPQADGADSPETRDGPRGRLGIELQLDPEALRIRLERMVERGQEMASRGQAALDKLDSGAPASEVLDELRDDSITRRTRSDVRPEVDEPRRNEARGPRTDQRDDHDAIYSFLKTEFPELWNNLEPFLKQDPRSADRLLGRMAPQIREILALRESHPQLAAVKTQQMRAGLDFVESARLYRIVLSNPDATQGDRESALDDIRTHAEARFDAELEAKMLEIMRLEARLNQLRDSISALEERRDHEVDQMVHTAHTNAKRLARQQAQRQQRPGSEGTGSGDD